MPWEAWFTVVLALATVTAMAKSAIAPDGALVLAASAIAVASLVSGVRAAPRQFAG